MKSAYSKRLLSASPDETECYLCAKRTKAESDQKIREKKEQQKLEQSIRCGSKYHTSPHELLYLSEGQNKLALEKQCCDTTRKTIMKEFFSCKTCSNEGLAHRVSENEPSTKKCSPENEDQSPLEDDIPLKVRGQPLEIELLNVSSTADTCQNLPVLNPPQVQQNNSIEKNNKIYEDNGLEQNSSVTSLNRHMFQTELLSQKSVSSKKWQRYQLFQIPFLSGESSVFSCIENKKSKFLKNVCSAEDKNYSGCNKDTTAKKDNKEKNNSLYIIQTLKLKPLKSIQPLKIPNFQFPRNSNKMNSKQSSTKFRETDWKNFEGEPSLMRSKQTHGLQKMSEIGKQKMQNDKSSVGASTVCSEFKEKNCPPINKQEHSALSEEEVSGNYFRCNSIDTECNKILSENYFKEKKPENSEGDDDQKSNIPIYISAKTVQNEKCVCLNDLLQRRGRKSTNENAGTFYMQMSIPVTTEALEKNKLNLHCGVHDSNRHINFYEAEPKPSTKEILDFQSYVTKNITFKRNCPCIIVQDFPDKREGCNVFRGMEMLKLKFSFQNMFGWVRMWTESFHEAMPTCRDDSVTPWSHCRDTLKEQCDAQELVKSTINRNHNDKIFMCLLAVVSKHLKVEVLKIILAFFFSSTNTLLTTEGKSMRGEKQSLCDRKQNQLNSCTDDSLRQTTGFLKENKTYPGSLSSKFVESIDFELHNPCQRRCFSRISGEEESTFLQRGAFFHNQKSRLCKGRHVRKHHFLSRVSEVFSIDLRSVSHKNSTKKRILPAKYLILLQGSSVCSSLHSIYFCNFTKAQYLVGANVRFQSYFPAHSILKFEKIHKKSTNQKISVNTLKQEKNKPSIMFNSSLHVELFKALPFVLYKNKKHKTTGYRNCITSTNGVNNEVTYTMKKYLGNSFINVDEKEYVNSKELQMNCHDFLSKKYFSVFDTYEKIPLATDSEDFDQIPVVKQDSSIQKKLCEESAVTGSKDIQCLPVKSNDVLILSEQQKATTEEYNSLLLLDGQINKHENCRNLDTCSSHLATKKVDNKNTYLFSENLFPTSSNQSVILPLDSSSLVNREISEDGHCRNSLSADKQKTSETIPAMVQYLSLGNPAMTDTYLQLQAKETASFSLQGHEQMNKTGSSEPATLKHLEYVKEQEERNYEQMDVTNVSQCETVMNYLIMSYSEYKSKTFIAAEEELKMPLSIMNNGCLEDVKDKYLPLENKITDEFEMKREFDLVLEELGMFHEISKENVNKLSSLETNLPNSYWELNNAEGIDENLARVSQRKICISSPICGTTKGKHITDIIESSLHEKILNENEDQKVSKEYPISRMSSKELLHSPAEGAAHRNLYTWDPAFLPGTLSKEQSYNLQKEGGYFLSRDVIRVQPLKTCKGPIRIGLSRKARPKKLHPYLK